MAQEYAKGFYTSKAWRNCRGAYIKSVGGLCENCLRKGIYKAGYVVHHKQRITPENINNPAITLNFDNLKLLCQDCHAEEHRTDASQRYLFDDMGNLIQR